MDKVGFQTIVEVARQVIIDNNDSGKLDDVAALGTVSHSDSHANGVRDLVAALLFPDVPEAIAVELANTALTSANW